MADVHGEVADGFESVREALAANFSERGDIGRLDTDAAISRYWPEFAANGKDEITVRDILTHATRLPFAPGYRTVATADSAEGWADVAGFIALLEDTEPIRPAGVHSYHALTFGLLLGEIVRGRRARRSARSCVTRSLDLPAWTPTSGCRRQRPTGFPSCS